MALLEFVRVGLGVGIIDGPSSRKVPDVILKDILTEDSYGDLCFATRPVNELAETARAFLDFVFDYFEILEDDNALATFDAN